MDGDTFVDDDDDKDGCSSKTMDDVNNHEWDDDEFVGDDEKDGSSSTTMEEEEEDDTFVDVDDYSFHEVDRIDGHGCWNVGYGHSTSYKLWLIDRVDMQWQILNG